MEVRRGDGQQERIRSIPMPLYAMAVQAMPLLHRFAAGPIGRVLLRRETEGQGQTD